MEKSCYCTSTWLCHSNWGVTQRKSRCSKNEKSSYNCYLVAQVLMKISTKKYNVVENESITTISTSYTFSVLGIAIKITFRLCRSISESYVLILIDTCSKRLKLTLCLLSLHQLQSDTSIKSSQSIDYQKLLWQIMVDHLFVMNSRNSFEWIVWNIFSHLLIIPPLMG